MVAFGALAWLYDFRAHPGLFFGGVTVCFLCLAAWRVVAGARGLSLTLLLVVGGLVRAMFLPLPPSLSDDVWRYLWDGKVVVAGYNPYTLAPSAEPLVGLRDEIWERTAHRDVETVYPPLAQGLFSISALLPAPLYSYKTLVVALDLLACAALWQVAKLRGIPTALVAWYAWNPLVVIEGAGMGHVDVAGAAAVIAAVWALGALGRGRWVTVATALWAGVAIKLVPLVLVPLWLRRGPRGPQFAAILLGSLAVSAAAMLVIGGGIPPGLVTYGISWEFNGPLFEPLWRLIGIVRLDAAVKLGLDGLEDVTGWHEVWDRFFPFVYPQLLAKLMLAALAVVAVACSLRESDAVRGSGRLLAAVTLLSATVYPWYLLWVLPFAALFELRAWLVLSWSILFAYLPALAGVDYFPWVYLAVWSPFVLALAAGRWRAGADRAGSPPS